MLAAIANYFKTVPSVFIDGLVWVFIAEFAYCQSYFGTDEAVKYLSPRSRFWLLFAIGSGAVMCGALKMFRSTSYADHQEQKKQNGTNPPFKV